MVKYVDLELALAFVSSGAMLGNEAYLCRESGVIYWHSEFGDIDDELPNNVDSEQYIAIPDNNDLDLGKPLVLRFTAEYLPDRAPEVQAIFSRRGAYARFKDLLEHCGKLQQWYEYEAHEQKQALQAWCEENGIELDG